MNLAESMFLTDAQFKRETAKCEFCEEKPCRNACPADCSPADFIMAAKVGASFDYTRAAAIILGSNPLGGICGSVCPDYHCMKACVYRTMDRSVESRQCNRRSFGRLANIRKSRTLPSRNQPENE
ncbi:MAG: hypothetical protein OEM52_02220 [bacterium]|nr:hypothetical protein [bacterium]